MRVRLERRHSNALIDRRKERCVSKGDLKFDVLEQDMRLGSTKSRIFYGAMKEESDLEKKNWIKPFKFKRTKHNKNLNTMHWF